MKRRKLKENGVKMKWQSGNKRRKRNVKWQRGVAKHNGGVSNGVSAK
jgi:hypothetical protein